MKITKTIVLVLAFCLFVKSTQAYSPPTVVLPAPIPGKTAHDDRLKKQLLKTLLQLLLELAFEDSYTYPSGENTGPDPFGKGSDPMDTGGDDFGLPFALAKKVNLYNSKPSLSVAGNWNSNFGRVKLTQKGNEIHGDIFFKNGTTGKLSGRYDQGTLILDYRHNTNRKSRGKAVFMLESDNRSFSGVIENSVSGKKSNFVMKR